MGRDRVELRAHPVTPVTQALKDGPAILVMPVVKVRKAARVPLDSLVPLEQPVCLARVGLLDRPAQPGRQDSLDRLVSLHVMLGQLAAMVGIFSVDVIVNRKLSYRVTAKPLKPLMHYV